jgi:dihydrofolate reductase
MPRLVYYVAVSLDGYIADAAGSVDWLPQTDARIEADYDEFFREIDTLLMGRRTYDQVRGFGDWPYGGKRTRVWTRRPLDDAPSGVAAVAGPPREVVAGLEAEGARRVWLVGGAELAEALRQEGLVDEWILTVVPRTLGEGVPLFGGEQAALRVAGSRELGDGLLQVHLRRP